MYPVYAVGVSSAPTAVRLLYCALATRYHVIAHTTRALVYGWWGCPLYKLLVVRSVDVYQALHAIGHALEVSATFNRPPESVQKQRLRCSCCTRVVGAHGH